MRYSLFIFSNYADYLWNCSSTVPVTLNSADNPKHPKSSNNYKNISLIIVKNKIVDDLLQTKVFIYIATQHCTYNILYKLYQQT